MAIVSTRLDGQTIGIQLSAPDAFIDALTLDMATGTLTSAYLTATDLQNLGPTVAELFAIVPFASRAAGALNILTKCVSSASVDASTTVATAVALGGDDYALRLTPSMPTASFVLGLPYSAAGAMAFAPSGASGGGGGVATVTASAPIASSGGANPNISHNASGVVAGAYTNASVTVNASGHVTVAASGAAPVTNVTGVAPIASSGGATPAISLNASGVVAGVYTNTNLTVDATGRITAAANGAAGGLTNWTEAQTVSGGKTIDSFTALAAGANADAALVAKGDGATLAQIPDGLASGGNVRGTYATDLQKLRSAASQVASGVGATIGGGAQNTASTGNFGTVGGGFNNANTAGHTVIGGGLSNTNGAEWSTIGGGALNTTGPNATRSTIAGGESNNTQAQHATIGGGFGNVTGAFSTYVTISGGRSNSVTSALSYSAIGGGLGNSVADNDVSNAVIGGGESNLINAAPGGLRGEWGTIGGGQDNDIKAFHGTIGGGHNNIIDGGFASVIPGGRHASVRTTMGRFAFGSGSPEGAPAVNRGATQMSFVVPFRDTANAAVTALTMDGAAASSGGGFNANILKLAPYSVMKIRAEVVARNKNIAIAGDVRGWTIECLALMDTLAATASVVGVTATTFGAGLVGATATLAADTTIGGVYVEVAGLVATNIRWAATIYATEVVTF